MKSIAQKIEQCSGLIGTADVTEWEAKFIESVQRTLARDHSSVNFSEKQIDAIDRIFHRHFA